MCVLTSSQKCLRGQLSSNVVWASHSNVISPWALSEIVCQYNWNSHVDNSWHNSVFCPFLPNLYLTFYVLVLGVTIGNVLGDWTMVWNINRQRHAYTHTHTHICINKSTHTDMIKVLRQWAMYHLYHAIRVWNCSRENCMRTVPGTMAWEPFQGQWHGKNSGESGNKWPVPRNVVWELF